MDPKDLPAFPTGDQTQFVNPGTGMSLRDYFAAKALEGWLSTYVGQSDAHPCSDLLNNPQWAETVAKHSYAMADAMLKAREQ